jgi:hypothetical protein
VAAYTAAACSYETERHVYAHARLHRPFGGPEPATSEFHVGVRGPGEHLLPVPASSARLAASA